MAGWQRESEQAGERLNYNYGTEIGAVAGGEPNADMLLGLASSTAGDRGA